MALEDRLIHSYPSARGGTTKPLAPRFTAFAYVIVLLSAPLVSVRGAVGALRPTESSAALPKLQLWLATVSGQAVAWLLLLTWMYPHLKAVLRELRSKRDVLMHGVAPTLVLAIPWMAILILSRSSGFPPEYIANVRIFPFAGVVGPIVAALAVCGMLLVYRSVDIKSAEEENPIARLIQLSEKASLIHQFLFGSAIVLGLGSIGTAALLKAVDADSVHSFTSEYVVLFGVIGTLFLATAYAPIALNMYRWGVTAVQKAGGPLPNSSEDIKHWIETQSVMNKMMGQDAKSLFGFGGVFSAFLPLVIGSITKLMGG